MTAFPSTWVNPGLIPSRQRPKNAAIGLAIELAEKHLRYHYHDPGYKKEPAFRIVPKHAAKGG